MCVAEGKTQTLEGVNCTADYRVMIKHCIFLFKTPDTLDVDRLTMNNASFFFF